MVVAEKGHRVCDPCMKTLKIHYLNVGYGGDLKNLEFGRWKVLRDDARPLEEGEEEEASSIDDLGHSTGTRTATSHREYKGYQTPLYLDDQHRRMHEAWRKGEEVVPKSPAVDFSTILPFDGSINYPVPTIHHSQWLDPQEQTTHDHQATQGTSSSSACVFNFSEWNGDLGFKKRALGAIKRKAHLGAHPCTLCNTRRELYKKRGLCAIFVEALLREGDENGELVARSVKETRKGQQLTDSGVKLIMIPDPHDLKIKRLLQQCNLFTILKVETQQETKGFDSEPANWSWNERCTGNRVI
ncbi:hypothetical protein E3N88_30018 [Mikania micrantha]|uniref:Uncharacterized protein n=1 Tax=Mikania micrantha TaxID=192012 RepID=A0A5N6MKE3_9ASTR|nr:hypothetical protein E3N88_30018 [Mikania micrantha]